MLLFCQKHLPSLKFSFHPRVVINMLVCFNQQLSVYLSLSPILLCGHKSSAELKYYKVTQISFMFWIFFSVIQQVNHILRVHVVYGIGDVPSQSVSIILLIYSHVLSKCNKRSQHKKYISVPKLETIYLFNEVLIISVLYMHHLGFDCYKVAVLHFHDLFALPSFNPLCILSH